MDSSNNLWSCWFDGSNWHWQNLGAPNGTIVTSLGTLQAVGLTDVMGLDTNNVLWSCWFDGSNWHWQSLGAPGSAG
jgi:hypothetical protein